MSFFSDGRPEGEADGGVHGPGLGCVSAHAASATPATVAAAAAGRRASRRHVSYRHHGRPSIHRSAAQRLLSTANVPKLPRGDGTAGLRRVCQPGHPISCAHVQSMPQHDSPGAANGLAAVSLPPDVLGAQGDQQRWYARVGCQPDRLVNETTVAQLLLPDGNAPKLKLDDVSRILHNPPVVYACYNPARFSASIIRLRHSQLVRATCLLFANGQMVITGTTMTGRRAVADMARLLNSCLTYDFRPANVRCVNRVFVNSVPFYVDLYRLSRLCRVRYDPELFAGAKLTLFCTTVLVFHTGKYVYTGVRRRDPRISRTMSLLLKIIRV